jgi:hypothetical protein
MHTKKGTIDVQNEFEFKMWVKMIASIHSKGGDISKPTEILWKSVQEGISKGSLKNDLGKKYSYQ